MPITYTPIRYPGGKSKLYPIVDAVIEASGLTGCTYAEAYCGGAGLAVKLLLRGRVSRIVLNDVDPAVYSMWDAIVNHADELCAFLADVPLSIDEWRSMKDIFESAAEPSLELGKAAIYLNRTNRSGILRGGPIGGMSQSGKYRLDVRFNRDGLFEKVKAIASHADDIELHNEDAVDFIDGELAAREGLFANFDPPYVVKGPGLYENHYTDEDHRSVAAKIASCDFPWVVTYDDSPLVRGLYEDFDQYALSVGYSAASVRVGSEILIAGPGVTVPGSLGLTAA